MTEETVGKLIRALGVVLLDKNTCAALDPKALSQCKTAFLEAVNQLPEEGKQLLLDSAHRSGLISEE